MNTQLLSEAAQWRLIGLLFECPDQEWLRTISELAAETNDPKLRDAAAAARSEATEGLYHSIFGPGGPAPPREGSYRPVGQPGYLLSEIIGYYSAFAYKNASPELPDHIAVEAGFVSFLKLKESFAGESGEAEKAAITAAATRNFLADHVSVAAEPLMKSLAHSGVEYLRLASEALFERAGKSSGVRNLRSLPVMYAQEPEAETFDCGDSPEM
jgi:nitrate reductase assembly molybdenum cofactor insertion protein NarJ